MNHAGTLAALAGFWLWAHIAAAETPFVLVNGVTVTGTVASISGTGVEVTVDGKSRTYPWIMLSPGTRYRYDQSYRMNLDAYQRGAAAAAFTNPPDPHYDPMRPDEVPEEKPAATPTPVTPAIGLDASLFSLPGPVARTSFKGLTDASLIDAPFWAVQTGPSSDDITAFVFPPNDREKIMMASLTGSQAQTITASLEDGRRIFAAPPVVARPGSMDVQTGFRWQITGTTTTLVAGIQCTMNRANYTFILRSDSIRMARGEAKVLPRTILSTPALDFRLLIEHEKPYLTGRLRMRQLTMIPGEGLPGDVAVIIKDQKNANVREAKIKHDGDGTFPMRMDLDGLEKGTSYQIEATVDLQPLFGRITYREPLVLP